MVLIISIIAASIVLCVISGFWVYVKNQTDPIPTRLHKITPNFQHIRVSEREKTSFKKALMFLFGRMFPIKKSGWEKPHPPFCCVYLTCSALAAVSRGAEEHSGSWHWLEQAWLYQPEPGSGSW